MSFFAANVVANRGISASSDKNITVGTKLQKKQKSVSTLDMKAVALRKLCKICHQANQKSNFPQAPYICTYCDHIAPLMSNSRRYKFDQKGCQLCRKYQFFAHKGQLHMCKMCNFHNIPFAGGVLKFHHYQ